MPHAVARGMDIALFKTCPQRHHLMRERSGEGLREFRIAFQFRDQGPFG